MTGGREKPRLLIAGGGYADIPLIQAAKRLGFHVITTGNRPDDLGHFHADETHLEDFSDCEAMLQLAQRLRINAVCACCNDFSALSAAYVAERMGLPGHDLFEVARIIHHKDTYRAYASEHGIPSPRAKGFGSVESALRELSDFTLPVIVKPVDLTGGKGIGVVRSANEAEAAIRNAHARSKIGRIVVEEYIEGSRHGLSTFVHGGRVVFCFNDDEYYFKNPFLVSAASTPSSAPPGVAEELCGQIEKIVSLLSLGTGLMHVQYILGPDGPVMIEICRRAPGDLYIRLVELATGVDYPSFIVSAAAGLDCSAISQVDPSGCYTRHCVMASSTGRVRDVIFDASIQGNVVEKFMWWKPGDRVEDVLTQKLGIVFLKFDSAQEMRSKTAHMQELIRADVVGGV